MPRGAKGLLTAKDLEAVGAAPHPDHLQHELDFAALFILEFLRFMKSVTRTRVLEMVAVTPGVKVTGGHP